MLVCLLRIKIYLHIANTYNICYICNEQYINKLFNIVYYYRTMNFLFYSIHLLFLDLIVNERESAKIQKKIPRETFIESE